MKTNNTPAIMNANEINARRYFINGKEVTANRYAAMKRLNAYIGRKQAEAFSRGDMENIATRAAWFTYEAAADAEYSLARYIEDCRRFGYLKEDSTPVQPTAKSVTVKRSEWNETAKRLECSGWYYIGTPTATGKTIYRRGNSELEIIIEEDSPTPEFSELSHAGQCLDIYLHNTHEIYDRYTVPAIKRVTQAYKAGEHVSDNAEQLTKDIQEITPAISAAARLVRKYDHLTPTAQDIEQVTHNYAAYIVDCAKYEIEK